MKKIFWGVALAAVCLLPLQAVVADDNRYEPVEQSENMQTVYVSGVIHQNGHTYVTVDPIEWYEGDEANAQFRKHEPDAADDGMTEAPDGYYVVNDAADLHTYELAPGADVRMQYYNRTGDWSDADIIWNEKLDAAKFASLFTKQDTEIMESFPYHLTIENGQIVKIIQQYVP